MVIQKAAVKKASAVDEVVSRKFILLSDLREEPQYLNLFRRATGDELGEMVEQAKRGGEDSLEPITIRDHDHTILDGFTRVQAARAAGLLSILCTTRRFASARDEFAFVVSRNLIRRHLTMAEILALRERLFPHIENRQGQRNVLAHHVEPTSHPVSEVQADAAVAKLVGKKPNTVTSARAKQNRRKRGETTNTSARLANLFSLLAWLDTLSEKSLAQASEANRERARRDGKSYIKALERFVEWAVEAEEAKTK